MNLSFCLRTDRKNSTGESPIALVYNHDKARVLFGMKRTIKGEHWNSSSADTWVKASYGDNITFNLVLKKIKHHAEDIANRFFLNNSRYPNADEFKAIYNNHGKAKTGLLDYLDEFIRYQQTERGYANVSDGTLANYKSLKDHLQDFEVKGHKIIFKDINLALCNKLRSYFKDLGYMQSSIAMRMAQIIAVLHWCEKIKGVTIDKPAFAAMATKTEKAEKQWLNVEEYLAFHHFVLTGITSKYQATQDAFAFLWCLGPRISDLRAFTANTFVPIEGGGYTYRFKTVKKHKGVAWPRVPDLLVPVIDKYRHVEFSAWLPDHSTINKHIKRLGELAGIDTPIDTYSGKGVKRKLVTVPKWRKLSTHTGRISFINIQRQLRNDIGGIAAMTGQSNATVMGYFHNNNEQTGDAVDNLNRVAHLKVA